MTETIQRTELPFPLLRRGKVRDVYDLGDAVLLVATDRVSAFDVVLPQPIPRKGEVLNLISAWWFGRTAQVVPNHLITADPDRIAERFPSLADLRSVWARRSMLVRKTTPFHVECVVRGYLAGSAWKEYATAGTLAGAALPPALSECAKLDAPLFSPATKAESGHDENISFVEMANIVGQQTAEQLRKTSVAVYEMGRDIAAERGIIIADTKFEFGRDAAGTLYLIDEVLTPDSSRFWPAAEYVPGRPQPAFDKQPLRDYLESLEREGRWNKQPPGPDLPVAVVAETSRRYQDAFQRITGYALDDFPLADAVPS